MRLKITNGTVTYCDRILVKPGTSLSTVELEVERTYGVEVYGTVGATTKSIRDIGNAEGAFPLSVCVDYPTKADAFAAVVELTAWTDAHTVGTLTMQCSETMEDGTTKEAQLTYKAGLTSFRAQSAECSSGQRVIYEFSFVLA